MSQIKFGTDGWRDLVADAFTFDNVRKVAQAIADYVNHHQLGSRGVVVGYDNRFLGERFAAAVAEVLLGNEIPVYMLPQGTPTPVTAFMIKHLQTAGAVMLTASHNPPEYNGIKFIPEYAGPALPAITDEIERYLNERTHDTAEIVAGVYNAPVCRMSLEKGRQLGKLQEIEPKAAYLEHLRSVVDVEGIRKGSLKVVIDTMYGCGMGYLEDFLRTAGCQVQVLHCCRDPLFGGIVPEPMGKWLTELRDEVLKNQANLGLAMDGDADRFGVIDREGNYLSANQVLYLLLNYLLHTREYRGPIARTVATTHMLDRIAARYGLAVEETAVGFKYIGQAILERGAMLGGEESGGLSIHGHIPEKDGILAAALMAEMVAVTGKDPRQLIEETAAEFGMLVNERIDLHSTPEEKQRVLEMLTKFTPEAVGGFKVVDRITHDGIKLLLEGGNWLLIRASGTEPMFRLYVEAGDVESMRRIQEGARELLEL